MQNSNSSFLRRSLIAVSLCLMTLFAASCSSDDDSFDYSEMVADLCDVYTSKTKTLKYAILDDDRHLDFSKLISCSWALKEDTLYRALLYYNKVEGSNTVEPLALTYVLPLVPRESKGPADSISVQDPLELNAAWYAKNGKYLNLLLTIKAGSTTADSQKQTIGLVGDSVCVSPAGKRYYFHIAHKQNDVPTDYSVETYASIPTSQIASGDTVTLSVPSRKGIVQNSYVKP